ncbi:hypothetical protein [Kordiimonas aestuarii]|uniref:hypothetical protein n=1 Tax=Kordiimonas aestuarii TaxID=1005925 RepID=UPI0021CED355|nr:hypothetical protein [Kordiimonas aestuarii]
MKDPQGLADTPSWNPFDVKTQGGTPFQTAVKFFLGTQARVAHHGTGSKMSQLAASGLIGKKAIAFASVLQSQGLSSGAKYLNMHLVEGLTTLNSFDQMTGSSMAFYQISDGVATITITNQLSLSSLSGSNFADMIGLEDLAKALEEVDSEVEGPGRNSYVSVTFSYILPEQQKKDGTDAAKSTVEFDTCSSGGTRIGNVGTGSVC